MRYPLLLPDAVPLSVFCQEEPCRHDPAPGYKNLVRYILPDLQLQHKLQ